MTDLQVVETDEYEMLVEFFVKNELEFDGDEEVDTDIVKCFKVVAENSELAGGAVLAQREGEYIIDGIAVDEKYRNFRIGEMMLKCVVDEVKLRNGKALFLVARAPGFFRKNGFDSVDPSSAPNFFECRYCPQYQVNCFPEVMKLEIC